MALTYRNSIVTLCLLFTSGCTSWSVNNTKDGPPDIQLDPSKLVDAVPKREPFSRYGNPPNYEVFNKTYTLMNKCANYKAKGLASWYGTKFHGRRTSSGETYDMFAMMAAHKTLPIPCYAKITNLENNKTTIVKINDRGPFHDDRLIDLSYAAAVKLGFAENGTAKVLIETFDPRSLPSNHENLFLQIGAFSNQKLAQQFVADIKKTIKKPISIKPTVKAHQALLTVRIGPLEHYEEISQLQTQLAKLEIHSSLVIIENLSTN